MLHLTLHIEQYLNSFQKKGDAVNLKKALWILLTLGIIVSIYLTYVHYYPGALVCEKGNIINCAEVITSNYSIIFGIPLAIYSLVWFVIAFLVAKYKNRAGIAADVWFLIGIGGMLYSAFSMYMLQKICIYCTALDILIILSIIVYFKYKKQM